MLRLIGLTGKAESGKDTAADYLVNKNENWVKTAFAKPLKDLCMNYLGLTYEDVYTHEGKAKFNEFWGMTNREILQKVGTEAFRNGFHKNTWTKIMEIQINKLFDEGKNVVVSDCRFDNEAELIYKLGGVVFNIERPDHSSLKEVEKAHASENGIKKDLIIATIINDSDFDTFYKRFEEELKKNE